ALYSYMYIMLKAANLNNLNTSNAQPLITGSKVLNVSLPIPPLSEQQSIADYLDQKCSEIDELISIKQQKIEKLKDYKKSLIFECVTGKRKV
ncbi:restriction endonuclease subunit S, partial [Phocaeicola barnesiae]|nr:restriction endonuclease subunit S [Phocaeicola barnesiae]